MSDRTKSGAQQALSSLCRIRSANSPKPFWTYKQSWIVALTFAVSASLLAFSFASHSVAANDDIDAANDEPLPEESVVSDAKGKPYTSPQLKPDNLFLFETFDNEEQFTSKWIPSKKENYLGKWELESSPDRAEADRQLVLPLKARHYAISSKLSAPFRFTDNKPLIVQYEVQYREGNECGGSYVKMLRQSVSDDLANVDNETPYSIMFGPDKCGSEAKIHFIIQYKNPKTNKFEEKHWKGAKTIPDLLSIFNDKQSHLFRLFLEPNNEFQVFLDDKSVGKGNLLEDLEPAINPPKEIIDVNDKKPANWDDRVYIDDPDDKKPEDWDEDAPRTIPDLNAVKPEDWLENENLYIPDEKAKKPSDWEDSDGEWAAPLVDNPKCATVSGCGEWKPPMIKNPNFKGKFVPKQIKNPAYKGKWEPRKIPNPEYFHDENPFMSLEPIGAVSFELWSMADKVTFDNFIVTSNVGSANLLQFLTWQERKAEVDASSPSITTRAVHYLKVYPWLWAIVLFAVALPLVLLIAYCCDYTGSRRRAAEAAERKKTDKSRKDDDEEEVDAAADAARESNNDEANEEETDEEGVEADEEKQEQAP